MTLIALALILVGLVVLAAWVARRFMTEPGPTEEPAAQVVAPEAPPAVPRPGLAVISKSEAQRVLRSQFGSLVRIKTDEYTASALDEDGELIVAIDLENNEDPYRQMLSVACQLQRRPPPEVERANEAMRKNVETVARNLLRLRPPTGVVH